MSPAAPENSQRKYYCLCAIQHLLRGACALRRCAHSHAAAAMERSGRSNDYLRQPGGVLVANWFEERCAASGPALDAPLALQPAAWLTSTQEQQVLPARLPQ